MIGRVLRLAGAALLLIATVVAAAGAVIATSIAWADPAVFLAAGWCVLAAGAILTVSIASRRRDPRTRRRRGAAALVVATAVAATAVLVPLEGPVPGPHPVPGLRTVELPNGSRLAYVRALGRQGTDAGPVVVLHGGPGVADMAADAQFFGRLAEDGHDVILYDQVGAGHSGRLEDPREYTLVRDLADLDGLLGFLDIDRFILVGHSYGATLGSAYLADHPERVRMAVFIAPGAIRPHHRNYGTGMVDRLTAAQQAALYPALLQPRALLGWLLSQVNPRAARAFAGDAEMDARFDRTYGLSAPGLFCDPPSTIRNPRGLGFYTNASRRDIPDLRPALARLATPTLVVKPQCDYLPWVFGTDIAATMPNASLVYVRGAGHAVYAEEPDLVLSELRAFLGGGRLPVAPRPDLEPPSDLDGPIGTEGV